MQCPPRWGGRSALSLLKLPLQLLLLVSACTATLQPGVVFTEPILRSIPVVTGKLNDTAAKVARESASGRQMPDGMGKGGNNLEQGIAYSRESRKLYTNDGHSNRVHSGHVAPNSWEDLDQGVFPQRNYEYPEPVFASRLPSIQRPPPRVDKPVISAQLPAQEWLVSGNNWVENTPFYSSNIEYGRPSYVVDKDLGSQVHMTFKEGEPCFLVFNLRKGYSISALRLRPSWSNGPKRVSLSFSAFINGPWARSTTADVDGTDGGSYIMERWQGKIVQGYRNHNLKTTIQFAAGFKLNGRFLRLDILDVWEGVYGKTQAVLKEIEFFGEGLVTSLALGEERLCAWPTTYDEQAERCMYKDGGG